MPAGIMVSFIVLTHQRDDLLRACLESIYAQRGIPEPYEIVVIDNGGAARVPPPPDGVHLHVERPGVNLGAAGGRNRGIALARGCYLVFTDDDARWNQPDAVQHALALMDQHPGCGAVAVNSRLTNGELDLHALPHPNKAYIQAATAPTPVPHFLGVAHVLRAEAVAQIGMYPERFFYVMEEIDLAFRLVDAGWIILYHPVVTVTHARSSHGRTITGSVHWRAHALNKCRTVWRRLPLMYMLSTFAVWSLWLILTTRDVRALWSMWRTLWGERALLRAERQPIRAATVRYLRSIGARLWY